MDDAPSALDLLRALDARNGDGDGESWASAVGSDSAALDASDAGT